MARPNWEYIRIDVLLPYHPKLDGLTYPAKWTLIELWAHCGQHLTDGFVRDAVWGKTGTASARRLLVEHDLAKRVRGGYLMHDYLEHQRSREEVEALRAKRSAAGRKGGQAKASATASAKQMPEQELKQNGSKTVAEAEAEAEAEKNTPVADLVTPSVEDVIHRSPNGHFDYFGSGELPPVTLSVEAERRRQADALTAFIRDHPEAAGT